MCCNTPTTLSWFHNNAIQYIDKEMYRQSYRTRRFMSDNQTMDKFEGKKREVVRDVTIIIHILCII